MTRRITRSTDDESSTMTDQYAHLTGDYYIDRNAFPSYAWYSTAILCFILPPVGLAFLGFFGVASLATDPELEADK